MTTENKKEAIDHPAHYNGHPSGVECITVVEHMGFNLGNAIKYIWRADLKADAIEDLNKACWYVTREIERRRGVPQSAPKVVYFGDMAEAVQRNAARDMAIAEAVRAACVENFRVPISHISPATAMGWIREVDLAAIIAGVSK